MQDVELYEPRRPGPLARSAQWIFRTKSLASPRCVYLQDLLEVARERKSPSHCLSCGEHRIKLIDGVGDTAVAPVCGAELYVAPPIRTDRCSRTKRQSSGSMVKDGAFPLRDRTRTSQQPVASLTAATLNPGLPITTCHVRARL